MRTRVTLMTSLASFSTIGGQWTRRDASRLAVRFLNDSVSCRNKLAHSLRPNCTFCCGGYSRRTIYFCRLFPIFSLELLKLTNNFSKSVTYTSVLVASHRIPVQSECGSIIQMLANAKVKDKLLTKFGSSVFNVRCRGVSPRVVLPFG